MEKSELGNTKSTGQNKHIIFCPQNHHSTITVGHTEASHTLEVRSTDVSRLSTQCFNHIFHKFIIFKSSRLDKIPSERVSLREQTEQDEERLLSFQTAEREHSSLMLAVGISSLQILQKPYAGGRHNTDITPAPQSWSTLCSILSFINQVFTIPAAFPSSPFFLIFIFLLQLIKISVGAFA